MSETLDAPQVDAAPEPQAPDPADDLRAALGAAYDEVAGATEKVDEPAEPEAQQRDERGRFARAAGDDPAEPEQPTEEAKPDEVKAQAPEEARPALPPELAPVKQVLDDYKHLYAAKGVAPEAAVKALFDAEVALRSNPNEAFPALAQAFGFDIMKWAQQRMAPPAQNEQTASSAAPAYQALLQEVQGLKSQLSAQQQRAQQAQASQVERLVSEFAADPKHAHFPAVEPMMAAFIEKGLAKDLESAYDMACRAHPDVSKAIAQAEASARDKASLEAQRRAAAEAKAKVASVRSTPTVNGFAKPPEDLRGTINAAWDGRLN